MRVSFLQQRLGIPEDTPLEFVNGGHGIKNPLANQERNNEGDRPPPPGNLACTIEISIKNNEITFKKI